MTTGVNERMCDADLSDNLSSTDGSSTIGSSATGGPIATFSFGH